MDNAKKWLSFLLAFVLLACICPAALGAEPFLNNLVQDRGASINGAIVVNGELIQAPAPYSKDFADADEGNVMVPLRAIAEQLGMEVIWDGVERKVQIGGDIRIWIGKDYYATEESVPIPFDPPPELTDNRTFVSLPFFRYVSKDCRLSIQDGVIYIDSNVEASVQNASVIKFPAYQDGKNEFNKKIYDTIPFSVSLSLPEGWRVQLPQGDRRETMLYFTPMEIYNDEEYIGFIGFAIFTPYEGEIPEEEYYKSVYSSLRLSSMHYLDSYSPVKKAENSETAVATFAYMDEREIENHPGAMPDVPWITVPLILSYDKEMQVYIGLQFADNAVTDEQAAAIAKSLDIMPSKPARNISVSTPQELIDAIAPDTCITIQAGVYDLSTVTTSGSHYANAGNQEEALLVSGVNGLTLQAESGATVELVTPDRFSEVMKFMDCNDVTLSGIRAGHTVTGEYECDAGVVWFEQSTNITMDNCLFYGCGAIGIRLWNCTSARISDTTVTDCSLRAVDLWRGDDIIFTGCDFTDNRAYGCVIYGNGASIKFSDCRISGNKSLLWSVIEFEGELLFERCSFRDNALIEGSEPVFIGSGISLRDCDVEKNNFSGYWNNGLIDLGGNLLK
ncbi:MAG: right-handed parallel beta-helix repeat-containing protein [Clostridiales bacterium]|nr:right-handed parallel beta-helix repeat-containing protein [Clostridiales bacterium]